MNLLDLVLGVVLVVAGLGFLAMGFVGAARRLWNEEPARARSTKGWVGQLADLVLALSKAPTYLVSCVIGLVLLYVGAQLLGSRIRLPGL